MSWTSGAGQQVGLELWRIEKLEPVKQTKANGKFHVGDSYILLSTSKKGSAFVWNIHFWLGSETSQDEAGVAAYKTVELDDALGGGPVQYREVEGSESPLFKSYFKNSGIEYLPGGIESGFRKVVTGVYETRLLKIKGKRSAIINEVKLEGASLNCSDTFVLDAGHKIYVYNGLKANNIERAKGIDVANMIDADERSGKAAIVLIDDEPRNVEFWTYLGGYLDPGSLPEEEDELNPVVKTKELFRISDADGSVSYTKVGSGSLERSSLESDNVMMVAADKIFLWIGKSASISEKKEATSHAVNYLNTNGLPNSTPIERVSEGCETQAFKSEFRQWTAPQKFGLGSTSAIAKASADQEIDVQSLLARKTQEDKPIDDGSGSLQIWVIRDFKKVEVAPKEYGQFYAGDSYILLYTYKNARGGEEHIIYFWLGNASTADEKGAAALLTVELDDSMGGKPVQVRVVQGKEPAHFRQLFKGKMVVFNGGNTSGFNSLLLDAAAPTEQEDTALFRVKGTSPLNTVAVQVPEKGESLNSGDCFILVTATEVVNWNGVGSNEDEKAVSAGISATLAGSYKGTGGREVISVSEGSETLDFWNSLGGKVDYPNVAVGDAVAVDPRLFEASTATGSFRVAEIADYDQNDLNDEDVYILDTFTQLFLWIGSQSSHEEKKKSMEFAQKFINDANDDRDLDIPVITVAAGSEPAMFTTHFVSWDPNFFENKKFKDPYQMKLDKLAAEKGRVAPEPKVVVATPASPEFKDPKLRGSTKFKYEQLKGLDNTPEGVDPTRKEEYLDKATFQEIFKMSKEEFQNLAKWKKDKAKRDVGLF